MKREMIMKKYLLLLCCCLPIICGHGQEVLFSTLNEVKKPVPLENNLSTITNDRNLVVMDDFKLLKRSQITGFNFVGQLGKVTPENIALITGVRLFILRNFNMNQPLSEDSCLNYFDLGRDYYSGLKITQQDNKINISVDLKPLGVDLIFEAGTYGIAFAPVIKLEGIPLDKVWYWYHGADFGRGARIWKDNTWSFAGSESVAFSIEGKEVTLGIPESNTNAVVTKVYPNPSKDIFTITAPTKEITSVLVYNVSGQSVLQSTSGIIDLSVFPNGVYWATVIYNDATRTIEKLIKT